MRDKGRRAPWLGLLMVTSCTLASVPPLAGAQQTVIVNGKADAYDPRRDDSTARLVVGRAELDRYGDSNLVDVLRRQPGITVGSATPGQASAGEIRMRGLGQGYTQILVDGKPVAAGFSIDSLAPGQLERIEIIRSATADMSGQAIAGTINLVLRTRARTRERQLNLTAEGSDVFFSPIAGLRLADKLDGMAYSLNAELRRGRFRQPYTTVESASATSVDGVGRPLLERSADVHNNGGFDRLNLDPAVTWTRGDGDSIGLKGNVQLARNGSRSDSTWQAPLGALPDYPFEETRPSGHRRFGQGKLSWHHGLDGGAALDTEAGISAGRQKDDSAGIGGPGRDDITLRRDIGDDRRDHGWTWSGKLNLPLSEAHNIAAGWEANDTRSTVIEDEQDVLTGQNPSANLDRYRAGQRDVALYAQDEWTISRAWSAYLGLRWQALDVDSEGGSIGGGGNFRLERRFHVASPVLQLRWKLPGKDQNQFRLALSRTYKAPDLDRLLPRVTRSINNTAVDPDRIGNPALGPELANGLDLAFEHFGKDGLTVSLSPYLRHLGDFIRDDLQLRDGRWTVAPVNSGHARAYGVEADAKAALGRWCAPLKAFELRANAARNWSKVDSVPGPDNRLADQVRYSGTLGLDYAPGGRFSAGGSFSLRSGGRLALSPTTSSYKTVQRNLDVYGLWRLDKSDSLRFAVNNLLAQPAMASSIYEDGAGRRESRSVFPFSPIGRVVWEHRY
jgi:outer membrane receptor for ferrienterochelin and colicins